MCFFAKVSMCTFERSVVPFPSQTQNIVSEIDISQHSPSFPFLSPRLKKVSFPYCGFAFLYEFSYHLPQFTI